MTVRRSCILTSLLSLVAAGPLSARNEGRIPAFARAYGVSCNLCHLPFPRLTAFGETFAGNGFRMAPTEPPRDTVATGDPLLTLMRDLPLAFRLDAYVSAFNNGNVVTDFKTPYNLKVLSGGPTSDKISYYFYFFLFERGDVGGIEDAFVYFNDVAGSPVDVAVGQFQISDPMFKRELRLEFEDYAVYRARIGDQPADLTYDRGVMAVGEFGGFTITGEAVNGNGRGPAEPDRRLDNDAIKSVFGHVSRDVTQHLRLSAMAYYGKQEGSQENGPTVENTVWMVGGDLTLSYGPFELNGQYIRRDDDRATFMPDGPPTATSSTCAWVARVTSGGMRR